MTISSQSKNVGITGWKRLFGLLEAFDEALDYDPVERAIGDLNRRVSELEKIVSYLKNP